MSSENILAYSIKQKEINYDENDLLLIQAQLFNRNSDGKVMVEKVSPDNSYYGGKYHIPGIAVRFGEHPEEAGHRILTEELEVSDKKIKLISVQSHKAENNRWYILFIFESEPLSDEEISNPCDGIDELLYLDLATANTDNSTSGLIDIREAMKNPGKNYI